MAKFNSGLFHGTSGSPQLILDLTPSRTVELPGASVPDLQESGSSKRVTLLREASTDEVKRIVSELYREGGNVGDGGTADAIRHEIATGKPVGGRSHIQKGRERLKQIEKLLEKNPNHPDRELLERLRDDLKDALGGK